MRPEDNRQPASIVVPPRQSTAFRASDHDTAQAVAADVVRSQIDSIYHQDDNATQAVETETTTAPHSPTVASTADTGNIQYDHQQASSANPYARTHNEKEHTIQPSAWEKYHSAWQSYYQQYYERYYAGEVHQVKQSLENERQKNRAEEQSTSPDEAMYDLRNKLRQQIETKATTVRKSRHFVPAVAAICVMVLFLFLQYNRVIFANVAAYVSPGNMDPSTLIVDPSASVDVGPEAKLIIPKITVQVPIVWDAVASDQNSLNAAMDNGVAWFNIPGANAKPGEKGNFVLSGHSSNDWMDGGNYKFIFARLEQIQEGDTIYVNYQSKRYTYTVTATQVVKPTDVSALIGKSDKPHLTLVTCTPLGTALNRLLVFADQVSPDPTAAPETTADTAATEATTMPSNSPTFLQRIFGFGG
ncbi:sortase [Patescibacteria group bacterium]|nr:sortase [Patescibacteria group bacterium]